MKDLTLNNGQTATYKFTDGWDRPVYQLENGVTACCVNLNGTYLHRMSGSLNEPCAPLKLEFQPVLVQVLIEGFS